VLRNSRHDRRLGPRQSLVVLICLGFAAYFLFHALNGRHGLLRRGDVVARLPDLAAERAALAHQRQRLEADVTLLTRDPADPDMIEEVARVMLGYVDPRETVHTLR